MPTPTSATSFTLMRASRVGVLQVVDELRQVLDRVDVVVRRRRDQADARASSGGRLAIYSSTLWPGSWPPSPGLAPWAILICSSSALTRYSAGHAEAARGHLLDGAAARVAVRHRGCEARRVLAALAGVATCRRCGSWRWPGSRAPRWLIEPKRHGAGREALDDLARRLDLLERDRRAPASELQQAAQRAQLLRLWSFDQPGVLLEGLVARLRAPRAAAWRSCPG